MKFSRFVLSAVASFGLIGQHAQPSSAQNFYQSGSNRGVAYNYYLQEEAGSPSDRPATQKVHRGRKSTQKPRALVPQKASSKGWQWDFLDQFCRPHCEPWTLFANNNKSGITVNGHTQIGFHSEGTNGDGVPDSFNDYPNRFQLHQQWLHVERAAQTGGKGFDWGFGFDYVYGTDGPDMQAGNNSAGEWDRDWDNGAAYGHALPQVYAEVSYAGLRIKGGHFFSPLGYETVASSGNFFYSRSYGRGLTLGGAGLLIPRTVTGVLADYGIGEHVTAHAGWIDGYDTGYGSGGGSMFLGGVSMMVFDTMHLSYMLVSGDIDGVDEVYTHDLVVRWQLTDRLESVFETVLQALHDLDDSSITLNNYVFYALNDCMKVGLRSEWVALGRDVEEFNAVTVGLNYQATANLVIRPELRADNFHRDINDGNDTGGVFAAGRRDSTVFGIDAILTY